MNKFTNVFFLPDMRRNPYQDLLAKSVEKNGFAVGFTNFPSCNLPLFATIRANPSTHVLHLHWINNLITRVFWSKNTRNASVRIAFLVLDIIMVRLKGIRVVWTVHNRLSHESPDPFRERLARRWLAKTVNSLIFHSNDALIDIENFLKFPLKRKSTIIPHGHYIGIYPENAEKEQYFKKKFKIYDNDTVIIFFGAIRHYKGISTLLKIFTKTSNPHLKLLIAGRPFESEISMEIEEAERYDSRINSYLDFIPDDDVNPLYAISHIAAIPFEKTLTSGSAILAMSLKKALLLPDVARVIGLPNYHGTMFYKSHDDLYTILENIPDKNILVNMGLTNFNVSNSLDWQTIGRKTVNIYKGII